MKKGLAVLVSLKLAVLAGVSWMGMAAACGQGVDVQECFQKNGDVNGDGEVNLSDAVYLLRYLFTGRVTPNPELLASADCLTQAMAELAACNAGLAEANAGLEQCRAELAARESELEALEASYSACQGSLSALEAELAACRSALDACQASLSERDAELLTCRTAVGKFKGKPCLPDTNQAFCCDTGGGELSCSSPDFPGQDGFYGTGCQSEGRFTDNGDGTVTDACTGLMWQKANADANGDGGAGRPLRLAAPEREGAAEHFQLRELLRHVSALRGTSVLLLVVDELSYSNAVGLRRERDIRRPHRALEYLRQRRNMQEWHQACPGSPRRIVPACDRPDGML